MSVCKSFSDIKIRFLSPSPRSFNLLWNPTAKSSRHLLRDFLTRRPFILFTLSTNSLHSFFSLPRIY